MGHDSDADESSRVTGIRQGDPVAKGEMPMQTQIRRVEVVDGCSVG